MKTTVLTIVSLACLLGPARHAAADAVVTNGRFTNVYVYPDPDKETWEQHLARLPASQKPADWPNFSRASIDRFTQVLMSPEWPSYFSALHQYGGINPPRFFGSYVASQNCVNAAMKDLHNGVLEATTIRSLSNCHTSGMDPSPQVNLIFSPDIKVGNPPNWPLAPANGVNFCTQSGRHTIAYHYWGVNTPNFAVMPTAPGCAGSLADFTVSLSHEDVEMLTDPAQVGHGGFAGTELGDQCENRKFPWKGFMVQTYRSDNDNGCWPPVFPAGTATATWVLGQGSPLRRFTGSVHDLTLAMPANRTVTTANATQVQIWIETGGDDLRGGHSSGDNASVTLTFSGGSKVTSNINNGREWGNGQTHVAVLQLPTPAPRVSDISGIKLSTHFGGGIGGDNWNVDKVALIVGFPAGSATSGPVPVVVHTWLDASGGPLIRFTGSVHDLVRPVSGTDAGKPVRVLDLIISTGNDDLRGGGHAGDNCDVIIGLANGETIVLANVNHGQNWKNWTNATVHVPLPAGGLRGGDIRSVKLHTGFGGGIGGDNWNVQRVLLLATLQ